MTKIETLQDLYLYGVRDMRTGCKKTFAAMRGMRDVATHPDLRTLTATAVERMEMAMETFDVILARHGQAADETANAALKALAEESDAWVAGMDYAEDALRDLAIVEKTRNLAHYPIAGFTAFIAQARALGFDEDVAALETGANPTEGGGDQMAEMDRIEAALLSSLRKAA